MTFDNPQYTTVAFVNATDVNAITVSTDPRCMGTLDSNNQITWTFDVNEIDGTLCFIQIDGTVNGLQIKNVWTLDTIVFNLLILATG